MNKLFKVKQALVLSYFILFKKLLLVIFLVLAPLSALYVRASNSHLIETDQAFQGWEAPTPVSLRLPTILGDNMVLQQDKNARIWGWAPPGQTVVVKIGNQKKLTTANTDGKWLIKLDPLKPGGPYEMIVEGDVILTIKNILVGEVWLCSGQSNMALPLSEIANGAMEIQSSKFHQIRLFQTKFHAPDRPDNDLSGRWVVADSQTVAGFSAVGYLFGRELHQNLKVPIGLIQSTLGGTPIENWMSLQALQSNPVLTSIVGHHDEMSKDTKGWDPQLPAGLYNGEIAPLGSLSLRGIIWYQGESNASRADQYRILFPLLIRDWRKTFGEELPFYFVQLPNFGPAVQQPGDSEWAELREAQSLALDIPHTGMAVAIDVGESNNIHPKNKQSVANRLVLWALTKTYGQRLAYSGPFYKRMKIEGDKVRIFFTHTGKGLEVRGGQLKGFAIAGKDHKFVWANAWIDGNAIVASNEQVTNPVAVRYAWGNNPVDCNLYNKDGLPAAPFRTDTFPRITAGVTGTKPTGKFWISPPSVPVGSTLKFTGNTIEIPVGKTVDLSWDNVRATDYIFHPKQEFDSKNKETHIWLPYGNIRGFYYEVLGFNLTDPEPGAPPSVISQDSSISSRLTFKFHFDRPISAFRLSCGPAALQLKNSVAGFEYSIDGKKWATIFEVAQDGNRNDFENLCPNTTDLKTYDLYVRCYTRDKVNPDSKYTQGAWIRIRNAGDVAWGDASDTFFRAQWQLWVTSAQ